MKLTSPTTATLARVNDKRFAVMLSRLEKVRDELKEAHAALVAGKPSRGLIYVSSATRALDAVMEGREP